MFDVVIGAVSSPGVENERILTDDPD